jgi:signal peptidase II
MTPLPQLLQPNESSERISYGSFVFWLALFAALIGLDQWVKQIVFARSSTEHFLFFKELQLHNDRFAFSLPVPAIVMYGIYALVVAAILYYLYNHIRGMKNVQILGWVLVLSGACSNIGERLVYGSVRDFILVFSGVFNLADAFILIGVVILLIVLETNKKN